MQYKTRVATQYKTKQNNIRQYKANAYNRIQNGIRRDKTIHIIDDKRLQDKTTKKTIQQQNSIQYDNRQD